MKTPQETVVLNGMGRPKKVVPPVVTPPPPEPKDEYTIQVELGDSIISSKGETVLDALKGLKRPVKIVTKGYVTVTHGERSKRLFYMPNAMKRVFWPVARVPMSKVLGMHL